MTDGFVAANVTDAAKPAIATGASISESAPVTYGASGYTGGAPAVTQRTTRRMALICVQDVRRCDMKLGDVNNLEQTICSFVDRVDFEIGAPCFEWAGHRHRLGYGQFNVHICGKNKAMQAHRAAYLFYYGELPDDLSILHSCDNRGCVNPFHLRPGNASDNAIDRESRGRGVNNTGENNGRAILNWDMVRSIRQERQSGARVVDLMRKYSMVRFRTIEAILGNKTWKSECGYPAVALVEDIPVCVRHKE